MHIAPTNKIIAKYDRKIKRESESEREKEKEKEIVTLGVSVPIKHRITHKQILYFVLTLRFFVVFTHFYIWIFFSFCLCDVEWLACRAMHSRHRPFASIIFPAYIRFSSPHSNVFLDCQRQPTTSTYNVLFSIYFYNMYIHTFVSYYIYV